MTNENLTGILMIVDRSGSIALIVTDIEGGFKTFIDSQKKLPGETRVTLVQFDNVYETVYTDLPIHEVPPLVLLPRGSTALYDAIGRAVVEFGERLDALPEDQRPGQVYVVVLTDGQENSSQEYTDIQVRYLVTEQTDKYGWQFTFLGANQDAVLTGQSLGVMRNASMTYDTNNVGATFTAMSEAVSRSRTGGGPITYTDQERDSATKQEGTAP